LNIYLIFPLLLLFYLLPALSAAARRHRSAPAIFVLTIFLGWTGLGWLWALIWALTDDINSRAQVASAHGSFAATSETCAEPVFRRGGGNAQIAQAQFAVLQDLMKKWEREVEVISGAPTPEGLRRVQIIVQLLERAVRVGKTLVEQAREGVPVRGAEPAALGAATPIEPHKGRDGRIYYRNEIPAGLADYPSVFGRAFYDLDVAGALHHQVELDEIVGGRRDAPVYFRTNALVYCEPDNPHDENAVAVDIGGWRVGYIARGDAPRFGAELAALGGAGAFACRALIENGWPEWRVKLDAERPLRVR